MGHGVSKEFAGQKKQREQWIRMQKVVLGMELGLCEVKGERKNWKKVGRFSSSRVSS